MQDQNSPKTTNSASAVSGAATDGPTETTGNAVKQNGDNAAKVSVASSSQPGVAPKITKSQVQPIVSQEEYIRKIGEKIRSSENILVALSRNPSVDEMSAAIGLTLFLDELQKHTTAIYSGKTPDALEFLRPESTFETNTASLQDFIIALNKDKADHLRYKLEGDFVKVFITPYKTTITEKDLEFSHGDYNVDLVLALNVPTAADLDEALSEHGRIMHNATAVDITVGTPGRFGEIEWSNPEASSVSEMVANLIFDLKPKEDTLDKEIATALLTGIVAATQRFSNDRTNAKALELASKLMSMGADQQLISANVLDNKIEAGKAPADLTPTVDATNLAVDHTAEEPNGDTVNGTQVVDQGTVGVVGADQALAQPMVQTMDQTVVQPDMMAQQMMPQGIDATTTMMPPEPPKDYAQMMAEALAAADGQSAMNVVPDNMAGGYGQVPPMNADMPVEAPPAVMPEAVAQNLPSAEQLAGQTIPNMMQAPEQGQIGQVDNNVMAPTEQVATGEALSMPPENGAVANTAGDAAGAVAVGTESAATGAEANPPVLPEVQVPVDLPELPKPAPANNTPPNQSSAFQIPGMG